MKEIANRFPSKTGGLTGNYWNWENGKNVPTHKQYLKLKELLKLDDRFDLLLENPANAEKSGWISKAKDSLIEGNRKGGKTMTRQIEDVGLTDCGCKAGFRKGIVLDPFMGAGTTAVVARKLSRDYVGIELNPEYIKIADKRLSQQVLL